MRHPATLLASLVVVAVVVPAAQQQPLFTFHSNAWLNLHHYTRAQARGGPVPAGLTAAEQQQWRTGVDVYKPYAARDVLRDEGMVTIARALRDAEGRTSLDGIAIDAPLRSTLERLMPIYQTHGWPEHDRANRAWIAGVEPLVARHGAAIAASLTRVYGTSWPVEPFYVDISVVAGPVGGFSVNNHITISSSDPSYRGYAGLEMVFHEASHGSGVLGALTESLGRSATEQRVTLPQQLWHAMLFYTAGEVTTRELKASGIAYTAYANASFYDNMCGAGCLARMREHWTPRLDGTRSIADSITPLVASFK